MGTQIAKELKQKLQHLVDFGKRVRPTRSTEKAMHFAWSMAAKGSPKCPKNDFKVVKTLDSRRYLQFTNGVFDRETLTFVENTPDIPNGPK